MNAYVIYTFALSVVLYGPVAHQNHPDFSGVWSISAIRPAPKPEGGGSPMLPSDLTIRQTPTKLSVSRSAFDQVITATFDLGGRESTNKSGAVTHVTRARWDGARLVIEGKASQVTSQGYAAWTTKEIYSLDAKHRLLIDSEWVSTDGKITKNAREFVKK